MRGTNAETKIGGIQRVVDVVDNVHIEQWRDGKLIATRDIHNLVVTTGLSELALLCKGDGAGAAFTHVAIGEGTTAATATDTAMESQAMRGTATPGGSGANATFSSTFNIVTTLAITESGVFNSDTAGDMLCRAVFLALNVDNGDTIIITWTITFANA